jgi:predicted nucleic acid-binding protein
MDDTNIFEYSFDRSAAVEGSKGRTTDPQGPNNAKGHHQLSGVQEFFDVALRKFSRPMKAADAEQYLGTVFRRLLGVHCSQALYAEALHLQTKSELSWFDSLIVSAAIQAQCDLPFTEDRQLGQRFGSLQVANPFL